MEAQFIEANLRYACLGRANLSGCNLSGADLSKAILTGADLSGADLRLARLVLTNLENANLTNCSIFGISAWNVQLKNAVQSNLTITDDMEPTITVDNLAVAQFIYLLLNNENIRGIIDTLTHKVVLILGRFTPQRKKVLDGLRDALRSLDYLPIVFDFEKPANRDLTETISTLAHMASFVIADITGARSIPQELKTIVPNLPSVPVQPLLQARAKEYGMFEHFKSYPWVLELYRYRDDDDLLQSIQERVIGPAEKKAKTLSRTKRRN